MWVAQMTLKIGQILALKEKKSTINAWSTNLNVTTLVWSRYLRIGISYACAPATSFYDIVFRLFLSWPRRDVGLRTSDFGLRTSDFGLCTWTIKKDIFKRDICYGGAHLLIIPICTHERGCTIDREIKNLNSKREGRTITATFEKNLKQKNGIFYFQGKKLNHASFTRRFKCYVIQILF